MIAAMLRALARKFDRTPTVEFRARLVAEFEEEREGVWRCTFPCCGETELFECDHPAESGVDPFEHRCKATAS